MYVIQRCSRTGFTSGFHSRGGKRIVANSRGSKPIINIGKPIAKGGGAPPGPPEINPARIYTVAVLFMYMYGVLTYHSQKFLPGEIISPLTLINKTLSHKYFVND